MSLSWIFFSLCTNHAALTALLSPKISVGAGVRIARWQTCLEPYRYAYYVTYTPRNKLW